MQKAYKLLLANKTDITKREHTKNIRTQQKNVERGICPRCGGNLVLRNGKYGEFYGCSNYPKCKFTKKNVVRYAKTKYKFFLCVPKCINQKEKQLLKAYSDNPKLQAAVDKLLDIDK